jgi:hypothetical protein
MRVISVFIFLLLFFQSYSQKNFQAGFIVKPNGDTVRGNLKNDVEEKYTKGVVFSLGANDFKFYTIEEIQSFGFNDGLIFRTVNYTSPIGEISEEKHFAKLLFSGTNNLFSFYKNDKLFFIVKAKNGSTYFLYNDIQRASGDLEQQGNYQQFLFVLGNGCTKGQSIAERVLYNESSIIDYFKILEKCEGSSNAKTFYTKPKAEMQLYAFAGGMSLNKDHQITAQLFARFYFSSQSKKTSLNIGFYYYHIKEDNTYPSYYGFTLHYQELSTLYEVPLTIQYDFLTGAVRPYFTGGFGLAYLNETPYPVGTNFEVKPPAGYYGVTIVGGAGIEADITKRFMAKLDWRYNFSMQLPVIGLAYRLK